LDYLFHFQGQACEKKALNNRIKNGALELGRVYRDAWMVDELRRSSAQ